MFGKNIKFRNFLSNNRFNKNKSILYKIYKNVIDEKNEILLSLSRNYKDSYSKKILKKINKINDIFLIGMGGSILGAKAIYNFLNPKNKKFLFVDNFSNFQIPSKKKKIILTISKSGNTLETISNYNVLIKKNDENIIITQNKKSYLMDLAKKLKFEVIHHNNFIGGRYSVLSEVGMLPAQLMGFKPEKFRSFNLLVKKKYFMNSLIQNVSNIFDQIKSNKTNSIIINYDHKSNDLFYWYQQLVAESLGKKKIGLLPIISVMPKDNHSVMQLYLDGFKNNFFTFFYVREKSFFKINNSKVLNEMKFLKNKDINDVLYAQKKATENVFKKKNIPFRSFEIIKRNEKTLGELFCFFILETILLGKSLKLNPYDQPSVELIKKETKKILI